MLTIFFIIVSYIDHFQKTLTDILLILNIESKHKFKDINAENYRKPLFAKEGITKIKKMEIDRF